MLLSRIKQLLKIVCQKHCFNMSFIKLNNAATIINNDDIIPTLLMYLQRCKACYKYNQVLSLSLWSKIIHLLKTMCHKQYIPLIVWEVSSCIYYIQHSIYPKQFDVRLAENGIKFPIATIQGSKHTENMVSGYYIFLVHQHYLTG